MHPKPLVNANETVKAPQGILQSQNTSTKSTGPKKTVVIVSPGSEADSMEVELGSETGFLAPELEEDRFPGCSDGLNLKYHQCDYEWLENWTENEDSVIYVMRQRGHS